jgi:fluoroquinolone resistance protein
MTEKIQMGNPNEFLAQLTDGAVLENLEISNMDLSQASAYDLVFQHCHFINVDLVGVDWENVKCFSCMFINCRFISANLEDGVFEKCIFFDSDSSIGCNFSQANLHSASFKKCDLSACIFEGANAFRMSIEDSNAVGAKFFRSKFNGSTRLINNKMKYADLRGANLAKCEVSHNELVWAILDEADFTKANLMGSDLSGASSRYTKFAGADLRGANLSSFDIRVLDFSGAKIFESQMRRLLENCELIIFPDNR